MGSGVLRVLADRQGAWDGAQLEATHIAVRHLERPRPDFVPRHLLTDDWRIVCEADDVDIVIEVMGGIDVAHDVVRHALENGKSVVTANKALMALHGEELRDLASKRGLFLRHEASVLGGIPVLHTLHTYFDLNRVQSLRGIVNGTCNYILTQMHATGAAFASALQEAQALGYAEPDPAADVEGLDAYYKLQILLQALRVDTRLLATECVADGQSPNEMARNGVPTAVLTKPRAASARSRLHRWKPPKRRAPRSNMLRPRSGAMMASSVVRLARRCCNLTIRFISSMASTTPLPSRATWWAPSL
ncbi:hypothetical protein GCM10025858_20970 [Alicyclobacillus sacchari]|nr:hypothetical protein GCM10025858_20970 [Alicyclobacillus sacchari]